MADSGTLELRHFQNFTGKGNNARRQGVDLYVVIR